MRRDRVKQALKNRDKANNSNLNNEDINNKSNTMNKEDINIASNPNIKNNKNLKEKSVKEEKVNININSKFNYSIELGVKATKHAMKIKKSIKDRVVHILVLVFIVIMSGVLVWDVVRDASIVIDLIILIALCCAEVFNLVMPLIILRVQKKFLHQVLAEGFDYTLTEIVKDRCVESYYKSGKVVMQNACEMSTLYGYIEDDKHIFLVFNNFATAIFDLETLENTTKEEFVKFLEDKIHKNRTLKFSKR